ncbi:MAG: glycosyltransferase [Candidatus Acidiferrum sp.]
MRILIHGINFHPEAAGVGKYTGEMAHWLAAAGHEVRVVTAPPYFPQWRVAPEYPAWRYRRQQLLYSRKVSTHAATQLAFGWTGRQGFALPASDGPVTSLITSG